MFPEISLKRVFLTTPGFQVSQGLVVPLRRVLPVGPGGDKLALRMLPGSWGLSTSASPMPAAAHDSVFVVCSTSWVKTIVNIQHT